MIGTFLFSILIGNMLSIKSGFPAIPPVKQLTQFNSPITLDSPYISTQDLCKELSAQSGTKIEAQGDIVTDKLAVRFTKTPLSEVLKNLAYVERAAIVRNGTRYILAEDSKQILEMNHELYVQRLAAIESDLRHIKKQFIKSGETREELNAVAIKLRDLNFQDSKSNSTDNFSKELDLQSQSPLGQLLSQCMLELGSEKLAEVPPKKFLVFSTNPTAAEYAFPLNKEDCFQYLKRFQPVWDDLSSKFQLGFGYGSQVFDPASVETMVLNLGGFQNTGIGLAVLSVFGKDGHLVSDMVASLFPDDFEAAVKSEREASKAKIKDAIWAEIPNLSMQLLLMNSGLSISLRNLWKDVTFRQAFLHPEKFNPDAITTGECLLASAKSLKKNLIYSYLSWGFRSTNRNVQGSSVNARDITHQLSVNSWESKTHPNFIEDGNWLLDRSEDVVSHRNIVRDDDALGKFLRSTTEKQRVDLDEIAELANKDSLGLYVNSLSKLPLPIKNLDVLHNDLDSLAIYGSLSTIEKQTARESGLPISNLSTNALQHLEMKLRFGGLSYPTRPQIASTSRYSMPTYAIPEGLPGGGVLHLVPSNREIMASVIISTQSDGTGNTVFSTGKRLATDKELYGKEMKKLTDLLMSPAYDAGLKLIFDFPSGARLTLPLTNYKVTGNPASLSEMPEEFLKEYRAAKAKAEQ